MKFQGRIRVRVQGDKVLLEIKDEGRVITLSFDSRSAETLGDELFRAGREAEARGMKKR